MRFVRTLLVAAVAGAVTLSGWFAPTASASRQSTFIASLVKAAQETQRELGIPASVTIAMAALETGWGRSSMTEAPIYTLFNIKCSKTKSPYQTGCKDISSYEYRSDGSRYLKVSSFRTYANTGDSLKDFGLLLTSLERYEDAFDHKDDPDEFVRAVHEGGYATDPSYTDLVTGIMRSYNLYQYDVEGSTKTSTSSDSSSSTLPIAKSEYLSQEYGDISTNITTLQRLLNARMDRQIPLTGYYGWQTQDAVADYQYYYAKMEEQTGQMDQATWEHLVPTLRSGDTGALVVALQKELQYSGYQSLTIDGSFGSQTQEAVLDFQQRHELPTTGVVAEMTWGKLLGM